MYNILSTFSTNKWAEYIQKMSETPQLLVKSVSAKFRFGLVWCFDIKPKRSVHKVLEHRKFMAKCQNQLNMDFFSID